MVAPDPPPGWEVWHERSDGILVLAFRPDVFDSQSFPASCLPVVAVKPERSRGGRGRPRRASSDGPWTATLMLEPDVELERRGAVNRATALEAGVSLAERFLEGAFDLADAYRDPPMAYIDRLETLRAEHG